jgi:hypothetical protein
MLVSTRPGDSVKPGVPAPTVAVDIPASAARGQVFALAAFGVNGHHDALRAVAFGHRIDDVRVGNGGGVEARLVGSGIEQPAHIFHRAHAAPYGERNEHLAGHGLNDVQDQVAIVAGGGDIEEGQLVRPLGVVARGNLHRIAGVAQFDEVDTLDDAATGDVQAGNDAFGKHGGITLAVESEARKIARGAASALQPRLSIGRLPPGWCDSRGRQTSMNDL